MVKHITLKEKNILTDIAFEIAKKEKLSSFKLKFLSPLMGSKNGGFCQWKYKDNKKTGEKINFKIVVNTIKPKYIETLDGKYKDKNEEGKRFKRIIGEPRTFDTTLTTLAHEIAHLKYHYHRNNHKKYTKHIKNKMIEMLKMKGYNNLLET